LANSEAAEDVAYLGMKQLDDLLNIFLNKPRAATVPEGHQTGSSGEIFAQNPHGHAEPAARPGPNRTQKQKRLPVVEISSPSSGAGKSQLLYYVAAVTVLPSTFHDVSIGGREGAVVLLDTDGRFDVERLYTIAEGMIWHALHADLKVLKVDDHAAEQNPEDGINEDEIDSVIRDSLQHVHIFRPQSSFSLLATLKGLDQYLLDLTKHISAARPLRAMLLDSASSFYWQDRLRDEVARTEEIGRSAAETARDRDQKQSFHIPDLYRDLVTEMRRLQHLFDCAVLYTTWGVSRAPPSVTIPYARLGPGPPSFRPHLPPPWGTTFPTLRLVTQRDAVRAFASDATTVEMERDAPLRQRVVTQGKFSAWIDSWGKEDWPGSVVSALNRMDTQGGFSFWVRRDGVFMKP
jgi:hypothetical protein